MKTKMKLKRIVNLLYWIAKNPDLVLRTLEKCRAESEKDRSLKELEWFRNQN